MQQNIFDNVNFIFDIVYYFEICNFLMPPKKKQQEIDLSTLPPCQSIITFLQCKGRKARASTILAQIKSQASRFLSEITKNQVLQHAKQKGIYVDPNSLTDKQKKDPKFMQTVSTQLTSQVIARSVSSFLNQLNIKVRIDKKANAEKPEGQRPPSTGQNFDWMYILKDFPENQQQHIEMAKLDCNVSYFFVINPRISWQNAPQIPLPQQLQPGQQPQPQDQEIKQFKQLQKKQKYTQQDTAYQSAISQRIKKLRKFRAESPKESQFRNTVIVPVDCQIDPFNQAQSINQAVKQFFEAIISVSSDLQAFKNWKEDKKALKIIPEEKEEIRQQQNAESGQKSKQQQKIKKQIRVAGSTPLQLLQSLCAEFDNSQNNMQSKDQGLNDILKNINDFDFDVFEEISNSTAVTIVRKSNLPIPKKFIDQNEIIYDNRPLTEKQKSNIQKLKYPGINRFQMPEIPNKSQQLRKVYRAQYGPFLPKQLPFEEFQRILTILNFEEVIKQADENRPYDFSNRVYEQTLSKQALVRQLYLATLNDQSIIHTKYHEATDSLMMIMLYKNPSKRAYKKYWQSNWRVLPNFQNWITHFKSNQANLINTFYYDIDAEKIGNIEDQTKLYVAKDGGVVISKNLKIANQITKQLHVIKSQNVFGMNGKKFFYQDGNVKVFVQPISQTQSQIILSFTDGRVLSFNSKGDVTSYINGQYPRTNTPEGYTIIYDPKNKRILHPNGGITYPNNGYVNSFGKGMKNNQMHNTQTLKRHEKQHQILKRDDGTVIVDSQNKKWIRFEDNTQYEITKAENTIKIQKKNFPFIQCFKDMYEVCINGLVVEVSKKQPYQAHYYSFYITFQDGTSLSIDQNKISFAQNRHQKNYTFHLQEEKLIVKNDDEPIQVDFAGNSTLTKNGKPIPLFVDEDNDNQQDKLPEDHPQPRLFYIRNDGTGYELLSEKQFEKYFQLKSVDSFSKHIVKHFTDNKQLIHFIRKIPDDEQINIKRINPGFDINLDIFKYHDQPKYKSTSMTSTIRSLIKHEPITENIRNQINAICTKCKQWRQQNKKEQNQYGFLPTNPEQLENRTQIKNTILNYRMIKDINLEQKTLTNSAIQQWNSIQNKKMTKIMQEENQRQLRKTMNNKVKVQPQYKWIPLKPKSVQENIAIYSQQNFYPHFFITKQGKMALDEMPEWVFRPKSKKDKRQHDAQLISQLNATMNKTSKTNQKPLEDLQQEEKQRYDTMQLNISPNKEIIIKPSVFTQKQIDEERFAFEQEKKSYQYHEKKRKDFDVYGKERKSKPSVPSLMRTQPISEINQKYLVTEAPFDKKVKISSMKNKLTSASSSLAEMRKQGPHATLIKTLDKRNDYDQLLQRRTMMVHADLNDKLQRDVLISPTEANFGIVKQNKMYEIKINIKNQDIISQRLILKKPKTIHVRVQMNQMGAIAMGMSRNISVILATGPDMNGSFTDEFDIVTKHEIYHIPISAIVLSQEQFFKDRAAISRHVKQSQLQKMKRKTQQLPPI